MNRVKTIHDPIHGSIGVDGVFMDILDRHEMQRLRSVKQLGMGNLVFPGANHTRFEHSLGVYHLSGRMADSLGLTREDSMAVRAAGLLHDVCHLPFSHVMEEMFEESTGLDHMQMAVRLIKGDVPSYMDRDADMFGSAEPISDTLEREGISADTVCDIISSPVSTGDGLDIFTEDSRKSFFPSRDYIHQIIHGPVDADQMDYLSRDAHYTGVSLGTIDSERLLSTMRVFNDRVVIEKGGMAAAEGMMVSRSLMYTSVYYHATVRIINMMMTKAVEASGLDVSEMYTWTDSDLMHALIGGGGRASHIARSVCNRMLYKKAVVRYGDDMDDSVSEMLARHSSYQGRKQLERDIADRAGVDVSEVIVDMPPRSALLSKISIGKTDVSVLDPDGNVRSLTRSSPIAKALQARDNFGWALIVSSPAECSEAVGRAATRMISL